MSAVKNAYIVAAKRTPFGAFGGSLKNVSAVELANVATKAALATLPSSLDVGRHVTACYMGNVIAAGKDAAYTARHVALQSGLSINSTALTVNRLCGSGFETVIQAVRSIALHEHEVCVAGGTEQMSQAPLQVSGTAVRWGVSLGQGLPLSDALWDGLTDSHANTPMGVTAENLARKYGIAREACDAYAVASQQKWAAAHTAKVFEAELAPVTVPHPKKKGETIAVDTDEHVRPTTTMESIAKLRPVFDKNGVVTAANASGICDGAGSVIVASHAAVQEHGLSPLCRIAGYAVTGCDPTIMGIGPVQAIRNVLQATSLTLADVDLLEINEAFAAQVLACASELQLDADYVASKLNVHGGAIALGHPLGASGSRITAHLAHLFAAHPHHKYHLGAACIGGGQGIAVLLEKC
jgi:acetyl-CoA acyltransferase 2